MRSFIPWVGGKLLLAKKITSLFPNEFERYIEVFGGGASVLFSKEKQAPFEVYNDINGNLVNLFRCIKYHREELQREIRGFPNSRELFQEFISQLQTPYLTDIQRAARFFLIIRLSFAANARDYNCKPHNLNTPIDYLEAVQERLNGGQGVVIENKEFDNLIRVYDRPKAFFYCDPPYYGAEKFYGVSFEEEEHQRLHDCLKSIKGMFLLSYNDCPYIRDLYKDFHILSVERGNNIGKGKYKELIISNYEMGGKEND